MDTSKIVTELKSERDRLTRAIVALEGAGGAAAAAMKKVAAMNTAPASRRGRRRGSLTPEGRKRLSESMKRRWAERRRKA